MGFLKPIIKREFLQSHALRYDETLRLGEDYALYTQALIAGARFCVVGARGYVAIQRGTSISARHTRRISSESPNSTNNVSRAGAN